MAPLSNHFPFQPVSPAGGGPLYAQIVEAVRRDISEGRLAPGAPLPSFRILAEQLMVSLITVKRAYEELEREGLIYRRQGLGTFVAEDGGDRGRAAKLAEARRLMTDAVREAAQAGLDSREISKLFQSILQEKGTHQ